MKNISFWAMLFALTFVFAACTKDEPTVVQPYESGVFITHEGAFLGGTGTVSFYNRTVGGLKNNIFSTENNGAVVGNILQSITIVNGKGYLLVNNANRIVLVDAKTFKYQDTIGATTLPRYLLGIDTAKAYVSEWGANGLAGAVKVLNLTTRKFTKTIATGKGAERMLRIGNTVWVANNGGYDADSTIAVIDLATDAVTSKINVGVNPNSLVQDANGDVWVLCANVYTASIGKLMRIRNNVVAATYSVPQGASSLSISNDKTLLYFVSSDAIYQKDLTTAAPIVWRNKVTTTAPFGTLYGLGIDPKTDNLFVADAKNYASTGVVYIYNNSKTLQDSLKSGIIPSNFCFQ